MRVIEWQQIKAERYEEAKFLLGNMALDNITTLTLELAINRLEFSASAKKTLEQFCTVGVNTVLILDNALTNGDLGTAHHILYMLPEKQRNTYFKLAFNRFLDHATVTHDYCDRLIACGALYVFNDLLMRSHNRKYDALKARYDTYSEQMAQYARNTIAALEPKPEFTTMRMLS